MDYKNTLDELYIEKVASLGRYVDLLKGTKAKRLKEFVNESKQAYNSSNNYYKALTRTKKASQKSSKKINKLVKQQEKMLDKSKKDLSKANYISEGIKDNLVDQHGNIINSLKDAHNNDAIRTSNIDELIGSAKRMRKQDKQMYNEDRKNYLKEQGKHLLTVGATSVGVGGAGTIGAKTIMNNNQNKKASDTLDELYIEKVAISDGLSNTDLTPVNNDYRYSAPARYGGSANNSIATTSNTGLTTSLGQSFTNMLSNRNSASNALAAKNSVTNTLNNSAASQSAAKTLANKATQSSNLGNTVAKGVLAANPLLGIGLAGASMLSGLAQNLGKKASDTLDELYIEKTAGLGTKVKKIGSRYKDLLIGENAKQLRNIRALSKENLLNARELRDNLGKDRTLSKATLDNLGNKIGDTKQALNKVKLDIANNNTLSKSTKDAILDKYEKDLSKLRDSHKNEKIKLEDLENKIDKAILSEQDAKKAYDKSRTNYASEQGKHILTLGGTVGLGTLGTGATIKHIVNKNKKDK